jgi:DNA polymerase-3 subunit epsilon
MRQIALDTETTGLSPQEGHRVIEIACLEIVNGKPTGKTYHQYINPQRQCDEEAIAIHGITNEFLSDKPIFNDIAGEFLHFIDHEELIIHNAPFDVGFLNNEFMLAGLEGVTIADRCSVVDTYALAKEKFPEQRNTLDALCKRFEIEVEEGKYQGAMLDAALLSSLYIKAFR